jgi:hypothetical protein
MKTPQNVGSVLRLPCTSAPSAEKGLVPMFARFNYRKNILTKTDMRMGTLAG